MPDKPSLRALRALHEKATPEPWIDMSTSDDVRPICSVEPYSEICHDPEGDDRESDRALIVSARNALPALLSIAEAARDAEPCIPNLHLDRCNCSACIKRKHLRAAIAQVEE